MIFTEQEIRNLIRSQLISEKIGTVATTKTGGPTGTVSSSDIEPDDTSDNKQNIDTSQVVDKFKIDTSVSGKTNNENILNSLNSQSKTKFGEFFDVLNKSGITVTINSGHRTVLQQFNIWVKRHTADGKLIPGKIKAALPGRSNHNYANAVDINATYKTTTGQTIELGGSSSRKDWLPIVTVAKQMGIRWGGDFKKNYDPIHFEVGKASGEKYAQLVKLNNGEKNPHKWDKSTLTKV